MCITERIMFYNEMVRVKKDFSAFKENQIGMATAYLPEMRTFAVQFGGKNWITFQDWSEEDFLEHFEIVKVEEE